MSPQKVVNAGKGTWLGRVIFLRKMKEYQRRSRMTQEAVATDLGVSLSHLRNVLYRPESQFSLEVLTRAATLFGCSLSALVDGSGSEPEAPLHARLETAEEAEKRVILQQITRDLNELSRLERRAAFDAWSSWIQTLKTQMRSH